MYNSITALCDYSCNNFSLGKVHGSLARAGKVRGQTPKVQSELL